jgi:hypothetical protein
MYELESGSTTSYFGERALAGPMDIIRDYDDDYGDESVNVVLIYVGIFIFLKLYARWRSC